MPNLTFIVWWIKFSCSIYCQQERSLHIFLYWDHICVCSCMSWCSTQIIWFVKISGEVSTHSSINSKWFGTKSTQIIQKLVGGRLKEQIELPWLQFPFPPFLGLLPIFLSSEVCFIYLSDVAFGFCTNDEADDHDDVEWIGILVKNNVIISKMMMIIVWKWNGRK